MHQPGVGIDTNVRLYAEVPWVPPRGMIHLRIALAIRIRSRTRRGDVCRLKERAALERQPLAPLIGIDRTQDLGSQVVRLEHAT
jgi:hypothetical protein